MKWIIAIMMAIVSMALSYAILNKKHADRIQLFNIFSGREIPQSKALSSVQICVATLFVLISSFAAMLHIVKSVSDWINVCKLSISLLCLVGSACFDYREQRIPNLFPVILVFCGVVLYGIGFAIDQPGAIAYLTMGVVAAVLCALLLFLASFLTKQGIGLGDIKLMCALSLTTGVDILMGVLFFAIVSSCAVGIVALITKKKTLQDSLPFAPFIYFGYVVSILVINF